MRKMDNKQIANKYRVMCWRMLSGGTVPAGVTREGFFEEVM